jgi:VPDSG-CTERM motif
MKKFLMFALVTMGLIMNAPAPPPPGVPGGPPFVVNPPGPPFVVNPPGPPTFNVPDGGSTALLLGLGLAALAAVRRKKDQT